MITAVIISLSLLTWLWPPMQYVLYAAALMAVTHLVICRPRIQYPGYTLSAAVAMLLPAVGWWLPALWVAAVVRCL